jgi:hypothetical protein
MIDARCGRPRATRRHRARSLGRRVPPRLRQTQCAGR